MQHQKNYSSKLSVDTLICFIMTLIATIALNKVLSFEKFPMFGYGNYHRTKNFISVFNGPKTVEDRELHVIVTRRM